MAGGPDTSHTAPESRSDDSPGAGKKAAGRHLDRQRCHPRPRRMRSSSVGPRGGKTGNALVPARISAAQRASRAVRPERGPGAVRSLTRRGSTAGCAQLKPAVSTTAPVAQRQIPEVDQFNDAKDPERSQDGTGFHAPSTFIAPLVMVAPSERLPSFAALDARDGYLSDLPTGRGLASVAWKTCTSSGRRQSLNLNSRTRQTGQTLLWRDTPPAAFRLRPTAATRRACGRASDDGGAVCFGTAS